MLPPAPKADFLQACEDIEKALTQACTDHGNQLPGIGLRDAGRVVPECHPEGRP